MKVLRLRRSATGWHAIREAARPFAMRVNTRARNLEADLNIRQLCPKFRLGIQPL
jgi:hypothetical protein